MINDVAICIVVAWLFSVAAQVLRQPLILAYLLAGFAVGPLGVGWVTDEASIGQISSIGLILLLFMIGLEIDLKKILGAGRLIGLTAGAQIAGTAVLGLAAFWLGGFGLGNGRWDAAYLAAALVLSSTVIVVKVLYEKREIDTLAGRITLGVLVLQDLFAILFLAVQPNLSEPRLGIVFGSLGKVVLLVALALVVSRYALPPLFRTVARLPELVLVGALAWCFLVAGLAGQLHLSRELGALVAGVAISTFPYALDVSAKVTSLRDFFVTLFFVAMGMTIPAPSLGLLSWAVVFSALVFATRFLTVFVPLYRMRMGYRASLLPALNLAQVSELSLVIVALGASFKHVSPEVYGIVAYSFAILGVLSTYVMLHSDALAHRIAPWLDRMGLRDLDQDTVFKTKPHLQAQVYLLGFSWAASSLLSEIERCHPDWLRDLAVIDFNPHVNQSLRERGVHVIYGHISQRGTLLHAGIDRAEVIICTLPNTVLKGTNNLRLLQQLRELNPKAKIVVHAELLQDVRRLYDSGASYVFTPRLIEGAELCSILQAAREGLLDQKRAQLEGQLAGRSEVIP